MNVDTLARAIAGERGAEELLFTELVSKFRTIACYRVRDKELARDIALEACQVVYSKYKSETFAVSFEAWAQGILDLHIRHCLSKEIKRDAVLTRSDLPVGEEVVTESSEESRIRLQHCFRRLLEINNRYARVINLAYQGYRTPEICKRLSISRTNYYVLLSRARDVLWKCLSEGEE